MTKCPICGREFTRTDIYAKLDNQIINLCSSECAFEFMVKNAHEGKILAIKIVEDYSAPNPSNVGDHYD
jgi:hypothetical protein